jgi:hypothetical protein
MKSMKLYSANTYPDEEGKAILAKSAILIGTKQEVKELAAFFNTVSSYLKTKDYCHMHFCDYLKGWKKKQNIDIEITVKKPMNRNGKIIGTGKSIGIGKGKK